MLEAEAASLEVESFELREEWLTPARKKMEELGGFEKFNETLGNPNGIHHLETFWFLHGSGVPVSKFQILCRLFEFNCEKVREPDR